jgi:hypothetical protein
MRRIIQFWYCISFRRTPFETQIRRIENAAAERALQRDLEKGEQQISVYFNLDGPELEDAEWVMTADVARWVGERLLEAADSALL